MDRHEEQTHYVKRVVLPSGKTIEVVLFGEEGAEAPASEPEQDLSICPGCDSALVYPVEWEEAGSDHWSVLLHCPNCDACREGVFSQATVERFDEALDRGADTLARNYKRVMRANMSEEIDRFAGALAADAIVPEDF